MPILREIKLDKEFESEVSNIFSYIESEFGEGYAKVFQIRLARQIKLLANFPEMGQRNGENFSLGLENLFHKLFRQNWIFYKFTDKEIKFLKIVNTKRDIKK